MKQITIAGVPKNSDEMLGILVRHLGREELQKFGACSPHVIGPLLSRRLDFTSDVDLIAWVLGCIDAASRSAT